MKKILLAIAISLLVLVGFQSTSFAQWGPPRAMTNTEFSNFYSAVNDATFSSDQANLIKSAIKSGNYFTCNQVKQLLALPSFDKDKIDVAVAAYDVVVDPKNWYTVYEAFTFDSDKEKLRSMTDGVRQSAMANRPVPPPPGTVHRPPPGAAHMPPPPVAVRPPMPPAGHRPPPGVHHGPRPMTDGEFANLYNAVKDATFSERQADVIISAVNAGNILTVSQAISLLKVIDHDRYKVEPAVVIYNKVYDRKNWYQIYDAFTFQSYKDEVRARTQ